MKSPQQEMQMAVLALMAMPKEEGMCLAHTRQALTSVGLRLPAPMPSPDNTAFANFQALQKNPSGFGWQSADLDGPDAVKLVYFSGVAQLEDPPRFAGHIGLLSNGTIYSDTNYAFSTWWRSHFAGAFVPLSMDPRLIVAKADPVGGGIDGFVYQQVASAWDPTANQLNVDVAALQGFLGTNVPGLPDFLSVRDAFTQLGRPARFDLTHLSDDEDPRVYAFV
jgi:hypothetical protein